MAIEVRELEKRELPMGEGVETTRPRKVFMPPADIYETPDAIVVLADMPGVDEQRVDITLEKNILTINGFVDPAEFPGYSLSYAEYTTGDYRRVFSLSNEVDRDGISAGVKNGVLRLTLPKSKNAIPRKIEVKAE